MKKIVVLGSGNVAQHLIKAISNCVNLDLIQVYARNPEELYTFVDAQKIISDLTTIKEANLYILAVSDSAIAKISELLPFKNRLVAHTSGSCNLLEIKGNNKKAVFYPLQTFSKNKALNFKEIPICLESENQGDANLLKEIAYLLSNSVQFINSDQRKALHVAAVFANNFTNHLYAIAEKICEEHKIDFDILKPLITETASKIQNLSPTKAQTGPAIRHDTSTINSHLHFLKNTEYQEIYKLLTKSILDNVQKL